MKKFQTILCVVFLIISFSGCGEQPEPVDEIGTEPGEEIDIYSETSVIRIGYVGHDHHSAVYISALRGEEMKEEYGIYLEPLREGELYALIENREKVTEIEFIRASGGGSVVPTSMAAGEFDLGFGGVVAFAASADQETGIAIVSPLHSRGDMLVVKPDNEAVFDWPSFLEWVRSSNEPVNMGYKNPKAVAKVIFEGALTEEGISFCQATAEPGAQIVMINMQGEGNLIPGLHTGIIDAYVSNNPWCALAEFNGEGKCVVELPDLPPGIWSNHPCCAIAATYETRTEMRDETAAALRLFEAATDYINSNPQDAAEAVAEWLGNPVEVEIISMATSGYDVHVTDEWMSNMQTIVDNMRNLNLFSGPLAEAEWETTSELVFDFSLLPDHLR